MFSLWQKLSLAYKSKSFPFTYEIGAPNSGYIQSNRLASAFDFAVRYTKGEEKVCVPDRNPWLGKMYYPLTEIIRYHTITGKIFY